MHDKALLQGICKHGIGRNDLLINDLDLPFFDVKQKIIDEEDIQDPEGEGAQQLMERLAWPKDLVIARRIDSLCDMVLRPKAPSKKSSGGSRKRKQAAFDKGGDANGKAQKKPRSLIDKSDDAKPESNGYMSDESSAADDSGDDTDTMLEEAEQRANKRHRMVDDTQEAFHNEEDQPMAEPMRGVEVQAEALQPSDAPVTETVEKVEQEKPFLTDVLASGISGSPAVLPPATSSSADADVSVNETTPALATTPAAPVAPVAAEPEPSSAAPTSMEVDSAPSAPTSVSFATESTDVNTEAIPTTTTNTNTINTTITTTTPASPHAAADASSTVNQPANQPADAQPQEQQEPQPSSDPAQPI